MAKRNEQVLERVRRELNRDPSLGSRALYDMVQELDPSVAQSTPQQFHARYVLPIKRERMLQQQGQQAKGGQQKAQRRTRGRAAAKPEPAKAEPAKPRRRRGPRSGAAGGERDQIRSVFLQFAREFSEAETRTQIVQVLSKVDDYVEQVVQRIR